jgi:hypothetical protein
MQTLLVNRGRGIPRQPGQRIWLEGHALSHVRAVACDHRFTTTPSPLALTSWTAAVVVKSNETGCVYGVGCGWSTGWLIQATLGNWGVGAGA